MGPLSGLKIIEIQGIGPGPFGGMMLSDMGAEIIRIDRAGNVDPDTDPAHPPADILGRGRSSVALDLKKPEAVETLLRMVEQVDGLFEPFRPGVAERLGFGPDVCRARNPKLVYGRITGWGQEGPYATMAGHDINYISLAGALEPIGRRGAAPTPPLNLIGDFGGGGMLLAYGMVCGLLSAQRTGEGQVVDAAMIDGSAALMAGIRGMHNAGMWSEERGTNLLDTGAHFYDVYETSDGNYVSIGSIEPQFYAELLELTGLGSDGELAAQMDRSAWPELKEQVAGIFKTKTREEWCEILEGSDICFGPVLSMDEAPHHPHNVARNTFTQVAGMTQPSPTPRFDKTPGNIQGPAAHPGQHTDEVLKSLGFDPAEVDALRTAGAIA